MRLLSDYERLNFGSLQFPTPPSTPASCVMLLLLRCSCAAPALLSLGDWEMWRLHRPRDHTHSLSLLTQPSSDLTLLHQY